MKTSFRFPLRAAAILSLQLGFCLGADFRPPAVPLITHDPYFSIWSMVDHLTDQNTRHWTGAFHPLTSLIRVDGHAFRIMGTEPYGMPALPQTHLEVLPTHTIYQFEGAGVHVDLVFFTPALTEDLDVLSRPASYVTWNVRSADNSSHAVAVYFDAASEIAANDYEEPRVWGRYREGNLVVLRAGTRDQPMLAKSGDNLRIDWGYLYVAAPPDANAASEATLRPAALKSFAASGTLADTDELEGFHRYAQPDAVLAEAFDLGQVSASPVSRHVVVAYDDEYSLEYFQRRLRPYWRRAGAGAGEMLAAALRDYDWLERRGAHFDEMLMADLRNAGGRDYAQLCALAYRQTIAAHKLTADIDNAPLYFSKENFSNGSVDTVDVTYPSSPFFLLFNTKLLEAQLKPILDYASLPRWKFPFAPHDLGRYPLANGQQYGGGEQTEVDQMPVEESGNMLLMIAAMSQANGSARFAQQYWAVLTKWAEYLKSKGFDPENQLCTDDFAGHLAHNANLSIKAILALAAYGKLAGMLRQNDAMRAYEALAKQNAQRWVEMDSDGDHFRLAFDKPGTWSQKYNLVWDKLLELNIFPSSVVEKELAFYAAHQNIYGIPLDVRADYTKIDWLTWTASLAGPKEQFQSLFQGAYHFATETPSRVPLTDWYDTKSGKQIAFQARSVVGGLFIRMLDDRSIWKKYAGMARQ